MTFIGVLMAFEYKDSLYFIAKYKKILTGGNLKKDLETK